MTGIYLTIDDSPSGIFPDLCAFLKERNIPAALFARGDLMSLYPQRMVKAVKDGFVVANHSWSHHRASKLGAEMAVAEVLKTQNLIDEIYTGAGVKRPGPYLRFPYMDSGLGGWPLPPADINHHAEIESDYAAFYGNDMTKPDEAAVKCHKDIETKLRAASFCQMRFDGVEVEWYKAYTASNAVSTQGTFCHPDWILNRRYEGKIEGRNVDALNANFDRFVATHPGNHVIVMHDSVELWPHFQRMIDHMLSAGHNFLPIPA